MTLRLLMSGYPATDIVELTSPDADDFRLIFLTDGNIIGFSHPDVDTVELTYSDGDAGSIQAH